MSKPQILLADDDRVIRVTFANSLRKRDFDVIEAESGQSAIDIGCDLHPDLAIMDFRLPDISGAEAAQELQEKANVHCVFLSICLCIQPYRKQFLFCTSWLHVYHSR